MSVDSDLLCFALVVVEVILPYFRVGPFCAVATSLFWNQTSPGVQVPALYSIGHEDVTNKSTQNFVWHVWVKFIFMV